jgi:hypothetical protein
VSSLLLIYGFIISLIGFALKYAQLDPLECVTYRVRRDGRRRSLAPTVSTFDRSPFQLTDEHFQITSFYPSRPVRRPLTFSLLRPPQDALALRESQTTAILTQVRNDVTRYRYGDEQHLEEALGFIFRCERIPTFRSVPFRFIPKPCPPRD